MNANVVFLGIENFTERRIDFLRYENDALCKVAPQDESKVIQMLNKYNCPDPDLEDGVSVRCYGKDAAFKILIKEKAPDSARSRVVFGYGPRNVKLLKDAVETLLKQNGVTVDEVHMNRFAQRVKSTKAVYVIAAVGVLVVAWILSKI